MTTIYTKYPPAPEYALWFSVIGPPLAFILNLEIMYAMVDWVCAGGAAIWLHAVPFVFLLCCGAALYLAIKADTAAPEIRVTQRRTLMARVGLFGSLLFGLIILGQWLATLFIDPCAR
jgi:hypothetical protein